MYFTRQRTKFFISCYFQAAYYIQSACYIQNVLAVPWERSADEIGEAMHVDGAGAQPWSERDFPDHALPGWTAEIQDTQALGKIQTGLDFEGSVEAKQSIPLDLHVLVATLQVAHTSLLTRPTNGGERTKISTGAARDLQGDDTSKESKIETLSEKDRSGTSFGACLGVIKICWTTATHSQGATNISERPIIVQMERQSRDVRCA
ncbi:hypothetical protein MJO28_008561 [Puccinia striiformis f. sp. tritici]|nr:hypothetical protein MJO28_008561 [Puccinia striiformis f. sp. tritici]KAI7952825.1 hypothetical protein MJO29_008456 [Puccinia striiformis f. sp. tritici]